jgi:hypothetical protein
VHQSFSAAIRHLPHGFASLVVVALEVCLVRLVKRINEATTTFMNLADGAVTAFLSAAGATWING